MRTLIATSAITLDGFAAGPGGNPLALNLDAAFDASNLELMRTAGTILLGRTSFELFSSFWPFVADAPADAANPALSDTNREFSRRYRDIPKLVVSDGYEVPADNPWHDATRVVRGPEVERTIRDEKESEGGDIVVFASHTLWNSLLALGLVDRLDLIVGPDAIGEGVPTFTAPARLTPVSTELLEGSRNVRTRYVPER